MTTEIKDREFFRKLEQELYHIDREIDMLSDKWQEEFCAYGLEGLMCEDVGFSAHVLKKMIECRQRQIEIIEALQRYEGAWFELLHKEREERRQKKHGGTEAFKFSERFDHKMYKHKEDGPQGMLMVAEELGGNYEEDETKKGEKFTPGRIEFTDGSAVVTMEHVWHIEGAEKFEPDYQYWKECGGAN